MTLKSNTEPKKSLSGQKAYRYNIKKRLAELLPDEKRRIMSAVKKQVQCTRDVIYRYINEKKGSNVHNNVQILQAFATHLKCTIEELINK